MKIIYFGYRDWSFKIFKKVSRKLDPSYKITNFVTTKNPEFNPSKIKSTSTLQFLEKDFTKISTYKFFSKINPDVALFYGWSWIIPKEITNKYLCLILHTSPLPRYRGGSPLQHQIINGETKSAISIIKAADKIDQGDIYAQEEFSLEGSMNQIFEKIIRAGSNQTLKVLNQIKNNTIRPKKQDDKQATFFMRRTPKESELTINDLKNKTSKEIYNFVRALEDPYPNAFIRLADGKKLLIKKAELK